MGLHNKFPSYFYKRGNLFNTYLNKPNPDAERQEREEREVRRLKYVRSNRRKSPQDVRADVLYKFLRARCAPADAAEFVRRVAVWMKIDVATPRDSRIWPILRRIIEHDLTEWQKRRYLEELRRRELNGEPLIRR